MATDEIEILIKANAAEAQKNIGDLNSGIEGVSKKSTNAAVSVKKAMVTISAGFAAAGAAVLGLALKAGNAADKLLDLRDITGLSTNTLQQLEKVSASAGVSFEGLVGSITKFTARLPEVEKEGSEVNKAFSKLGVSIRNNDGSFRDSNKVFIESVKALQNIQNVTERNSTAQQVFGRSLTDLAPVLAMTGEQFDEILRRSEKGIVSEETLKQANEFRAVWDEAAVTVKNLFIEFGAAIAPILSDFVLMAEPILDFMRNLSPAAKQAGVGLAALIPILISLNMALGPIGLAIGVVAAGLTFAAIKTRQYSEEQRKANDVVYNASTVTKFATQDAKNLVEQYELMSDAFDRLGNSAIVPITALGKIGEALNPMERAQAEIKRIDDQLKQLSGGGIRVFNGLIINSAEELQRVRTELNTQKQTYIQSIEAMKQADQRRSDAKLRAIEDEKRAEKIEYDAFLEGIKTRVIAERDAIAQVDEASKAAADAEKARAQEIKDKRKEAAQEAFNIGMQFANATSQLAKANTDFQIAEIDRKLEAGQLSEEQADAQRKKLMREQAKRDRGMAIFNAIMGAAQSIVGIWARFGYNPILAGSLTGLAAAATGVQIAAISRAPMPAFADGGVMQSSGYAMVGERGPEMVRLPAGAQVYNNRTTQETLNNQRVNISVNGINDPIEFINAVEREYGRRVFA